MTYCFDLDGTLCTNKNGDYLNSNPFNDRINKVNELYNTGNKIIINTARGYSTGIDWYEITKNQLQEWGLKYHELFVGKKIEADLFIDDKGISDIEFFKK
jgi:hydroxymethylpyrimidine pyrophosphatase-like HAD family hydrolase